MSSEYSIEPVFNDPIVTSKPRRMAGVLAVVVLLLIAVVAAFLFWLERAPNTFPTNTEIVILPGTSVHGITDQLQAQGIVRSSLLLYAIIVLWHNPSDLKASTYIFDTPLHAREVAVRLTKGDFSNDLITFTHVEGESVEDAAQRANSLLTDFDTTTFITLGKPFEGTIFPDTYHVPKKFTARALLQLMQKNYEEKITPLREKITVSGLTETEVITIASILEREANSPESMKMVAGILHNRIKKGMYLQVDASLEYSLHKTLQELTAADLEIDSPYNTYTNPGLPPTPIGNPGLDAVMAVLEPTHSDYFFYITDSDGNFHYAKTFEEHKANVAKWLKG